MLSLDHPNPGVAAVERLARARGTIDHHRMWKALRIVLVIED
jgi:hypothetical protein